MPLLNFCDDLHVASFFAIVNLSSRSLYAIFHLSVVCVLSVALVHPTQPVEIFGNFSSLFGTLAIR